MDSKVEENYKIMRSELNELLNSDKRLTAIMDKISKGTASFKDSAEYSQIVAEHMGNVISKHIGNIKIPMGKEMVCKELLKENIERVDTVFGKVQVSVDEKMGIHLNPVTPPYPTERVNAIAHSLEDPNADDEKVARRGKSSGNVVAARHDENVKANAAWREKAGFDCYLVRDAGGGCCPWCQALEGRYEYASAPDDIFRRHDNCTCTVTYECGKMRQDVWSKKTWEADPKDVEARIEASEAAKPTVKTPAEAEAINEQSKSNIKVLSKEEAEALNEQNKPTVFTEAEAKEREAKALGKDDNVNNKSLDNPNENVKIEESEAHKKTIKYIDALKIESVPTKAFDTIPSENEIIDRLSGGDTTKGSCTSLAFAYAGNKGGVDVLDFRGGDSCEFFAKTANIIEIANFKDVNATIVKNTNDFKAVNELLKGTVPGKEYILVTGKHTAVIRKINEGFEYLNMQNSDSKENVFKPLTTKALKSRFGCQKSYTINRHQLQASSLLFDRESLSNSEEFKDLLRFINTNDSKQLKGVGGHDR